MISLDLLEVVNKRSGLKVCGLYFLFKRDKLIYIGRSNDIKKRIRIHKYKIDYDKYAIYPIPFHCYYEESTKLEKELIERHKPELNCQLNPDYVYYNQKK